MPRKKKAQTLDERILAFRVSLDRGPIDDLMADIEAELYTLRRRVELAEARLAAQVVDDESPSDR